MSLARRALPILLLLVVIGGALAWYVTHRVDSTPVQVAPTVPERWTLVTSDGTDPWIVAVKPPDTLTASLFAEVSRRVGARLVAPAHPAIPLVLRSEFDEALQGAFGVDSIHRMAADAALDGGKAFEPVCLAHQTVDGAEGRADLYFVPFESAGFNQLRVSLIPEHPEQAGIGEYDPALISPVLVIGATENGFERWWPIRVNRDRDCQAPVTSARP